MFPFGQNLFNTNFYWWLGDRNSWDIMKIWTRAEDAKRARKMAGIQQFFNCSPWVRWDLGDQKCQLDRSRREFSCLALISTSQRVPTHSLTDWVSEWIGECTDWVSIYLCVFGGWAWLALECDGMSEYQPSRWMILMRSNSLTSLIMSLIKCSTIEILAGGRIGG